MGLGALQLAFEQLKKRLEAEGLFSMERGKSRCRCCRGRIGLITSPRGAAVRDVVRILAAAISQCAFDAVSRARAGRGRGRGNCRALRLFNRRQRVDRDVILLVRGGGSH